MGKRGYLILTLFLILIVSIMSLPLVFSEKFGYNNPSLPQLIEDLFGGNPSSFYMPNNKSVFGNFSFDGTCLEGGVEIKNGIICGQILQVFNITSLNVTLQNLTIIDNLIVDGNITADFFFGNGSQLTDISASAIPDIYLFNTGDTATGDYTFDTDTLFIDSINNRVGIGTTTPQDTLTVVGDTNITGDVFFNLEGSNNFTIQFDGFDVFRFDPFVYEFVATDNAPTINFRDAGIFYLPVGTSFPFPGTGLTLEGAVLLRTDLDKFYGNINGTSEGWQIFNQNFDDVYNTESGNHIITVDDGNIIWNFTNVNIGRNMIIDLSGSATFPTKFIIKKTSSCSGCGGNDGNVMFEIVGDSNQADDTISSVTWQPFVDDTSDFGSANLRWRNLFLASNLTVDTDTFFVDSNNNRVGIKTTSPHGTLHILTADSSSGVLSTSFDDLVIENTDETGITILSPDNTDSGIVFGSPSNKLAVLMNWVFDNKLLSIGTLETDGEIAFFSGLDNEAMRIDSSGNVGIGTSTPQDTLNVVGDINATGDIFSNNFQVISYNRTVDIKNVTMKAVI